MSIPVLLQGNADFWFERAGALGDMIVERQQVDWSRWRGIALKDVIRESERMLKRQRGLEGE